MFISLELHLYDFVKDTEIALAIDHYEKKIAKYLKNDQNYGFNIQYLFWSIVSGIVLGQVLVPIYWFLNKDRPQFFQTDKDNSRLIKVLVTVLPYIPGLLPILVFCNIVTVKKRIEFQQDQMTSLQSFEFVHLKSELTRANLEKFIVCCEEKLKLENLRSDIKCLEIVSETYLQMVFQAIVLLRLRIVIKKDQILGFEFDFVTFVVITMIISCISMIFGIRAYHIRNKKHLRPFSFGTVLLMFSWIILIATKIILNAICFLNYPGLVYVPVVIQITITFVVLRFTKISPSFQSLSSHLQMVHTLMVSLIPLSLTDISQQVKSFKHLPLSVAFILYFTECSFVLFFSSMMNNFYHFEEYRKYQALFTQNLIKLIPLPVEDFNGILSALILLVIISVIISGVLQIIYYTVLHSKTKMFSDIVQEEEKKINSKEAKNDFMENGLPMATFKQDGDVKQD